MAITKLKSKLQRKHVSRWTANPSHGEPFRSVNRIFDFGNEDAFSGETVAGCNWYWAVRDYVIKETFFFIQQYSSSASSVASRVRNACKRRQTLTIIDILVKLNLSSIKYGCTLVTWNLSSDKLHCNLVERNWQISIQLIFACKRSQTLTSIDILVTSNLSSAKLWLHLGHVKFVRR